MALIDIFNKKQRDMQAQIVLWAGAGFSKTLEQVKTTPDGDLELSDDAALPDPKVDYFRAVSDEYKALGKKFGDRLPKKSLLKLYDLWFAIVGDDEQFRDHYSKLMFERGHAWLQHLTLIRQEAKQRYASYHSGRATLAEKQEHERNKTDELKEWAGQPENRIKLDRDEFKKWLFSPFNRDPALWHDLALNMDPDGSDEIFTWIISQSTCHKGTAAYIFYINSIYNLDFKDDPEPQLYPGTLNLLRIIEKNWNAGFYENDAAPVRFEKGTLKIPSSLKNSRNYDPESRWAISDDMFIDRKRPPFVGRYRFDEFGGGLRYAHPELERSR